MNIKIKCIHSQVLKKRKVNLHKAFLPVCKSCSTASRDNNASRLATLTASLALTRRFRTWRRPDSDNSTYVICEDSECCCCCGKEQKIKKWKRLKPGDPY